MPEAIFDLETCPCHRPRYLELTRACWHLTFPALRNLPIHETDGSFYPADPRLELLNNFSVKSLSVENSWLVGNAMIIFHHVKELHRERSGYPSIEIPRLMRVFPALEHFDYTDGVTLSDPKVDGEGRGGADSVCRFRTLVLFEAAVERFCRDKLMGRWPFLTRVELENAKEKSRSPQRKIFVGLSRFTQLEELNFGYQGLNGLGKPSTRKMALYCDSYGIGFDLKSGLSELDGLGRLRMIGFRGVDHTIGEEEREWL
ncbi:hypothetical protein BGX29_012267 [Mortierella sp. GBA35]|nr:hypothetical protein BGX29_012267 [Mortierella sp. GBA35]